MVSYTEDSLDVPMDAGTTAGYDVILTDRDLYAAFNGTGNLTVQSSTDINMDDRTIYDDMTTLFNFDCEFNLTLCGNSTNSTAPVEYKFWSLVLVVFPFLTVFGNILVVMSVYRERSLRTVTNYFICSLAVADILVAVIVMPPAVYVEVVGYWGLSDELCDAWVASDVMSCTASILNLTAISVDRFIAVTQPIKYSKHKNSKRVFIMLALTWVISIAIAAPIALGVNYSDHRKKNDCAFFNADFIIYSSMGSFYIPSLMMLFLYWRIYRVLQLRARKMMGKSKNLDKKTIKNVVENTAVTASMATVTTPLSTMDNGRLNPSNANTFNRRDNCIIEEPSMTNLNTGSSSQDPEDDSGERSFDQPPHNHQTEVLIVNPHARDDYNGEPDLKDQAETKFSSDNSSKKINAGTSKRKFPGLRKDGSGKKKTVSSKKVGGKFHFHMRASRKRKEKTSSRKERKATKTLAIVLGVFLFCWVPFFTVNIIDAICIRYDIQDTSACAKNEAWLYSFFVWLGYINSFLNPIIYTIFNPEFRKAFKKILSERCK